MFKLSDQLCFPIYASSRLITQLYTPFLKELDLTYPQYLVMLVLWEEGAMCVKELGDRLLLDSGTLTPLLKKLEANKYITRTRHPQDERLMSIKVTPKGKAIKEKIAEIPAKMVCQLDFTPEELSQYRELFQKFFKKLSHSCSCNKKAKKSK